MIKSYYDDIERQHSQIKDSVEEILTNYKSVSVVIKKGNIKIIGVIIKSMPQ